MFLSMNPTVVVLNCPDCWAPIMYDESGTHVLSDSEIREITTPGDQIGIDQLLDETSRDNSSNRLPPEQLEVGSHHRMFAKEVCPAVVSSGSHILSHAVKRGHITHDDVVNLRIDLARCPDVLTFLEHV